MPKNKNHDYVPKVDDIKQISFLPRDIRIGASGNKGELLFGWCETTVTRQLWVSIGEGNAKFVGFIVNEK